MSNKLVIGVTGTLCCGKGVVSQLLKAKGCDTDTFSSIIKDSLKAHGIEINRKNLQDEGNRLRKEFGGKVLAERLLLKHKDSSKPLVIDGIRNVGEIDYLKKHSHFFLIAVDAPIELRYSFTKKRGGEKDMIDYDEFVLLDQRDRGMNEPANGQQVGVCLTYADYLLYNDEIKDKIEDSKLYKEILEIYDEILEKSRH